RAGQRRNDRRRHRHDDSAIKAALSAVLPQTPAKKRGAKGETLFFYGPEIKESKSWNINGKRVIDLIGPGRQTVLPPSLHPDTGSPYVWSGAETLEDLEACEDRRQYGISSLIEIGSTAAASRLCAV